MSEPSTQLPMSRPCGKCGASVTVAGDRCAGCGAVLPGNRLRLGAGARSLRPASALYPELAEVLAEREAAILSDLGGAGNVTEIQRQFVARFTQASAIADDLGADIVRNGTLTGKGRARAAVSLYLSVLDRLTRLGSALGLERRQKPARSLADVLAAHEEPGE